MFSERPTLGNSILDFELSRTPIRDLQEPVFEIPVSERVLINENVELVFEDPSNLLTPDKNNQFDISSTPVRRINSPGIKVVKYIVVFTCLN